MESKVNWETSMDTALSRARAEGKPILLDFFNPGWIGCQQMDAVTYPEPAVIDFMNRSLVPVRVPYNAKPYADDFNVKWTPTLVSLDSSGKEHHRTVGFLQAEELIASLSLGMAKVQFDQDQFDSALAHLERLLQAYPKSSSAPEAIFLRGVSLYKSTHDPKPLKQAYERLEAEYPGDEWTKRAYPYRLL